jgi:exopolysaccharide production protein ExoY
MNKQQGQNAAIRDFSTALSRDYSGRLPSWKRFVDITFSLVVIMCLLPIIIMLAVFIKLSSRGPILFTQQRIGYRGERFTIFKFRTMIVGADAAVHEAYVANLIQANRPMTKMDDRGDPRLVPFGAALRATGLDELPQLINILRGEMSLVGPRPCVPSEYERYLPHQRKRFNAVPGLTGLWQVSGKNRTTFNEMVDLDIRYSRTQSPWLDLTILAKTVPAIMAQVNDARVRAKRRAEAAGRRADPQNHQDQRE